MKRFSRGITVAVVSACFSIAAPLSAEHLFLKDGSIREGVILRENDRAVTLQTPDGKKQEIPRSEILRTLYEDDYRKLRYVGLVSGEEIEAYIVDENQDGYAYRTDLASPVEKIIPKKKVMYISFKSMTGKPKETKYEKPEIKEKEPRQTKARTGIWKQTAFTPAMIERHRLGILLGSGVIHTRGMMDDSHTGWSGFLAGFYYQWTYLDLVLSGNIGHQAMGAYLTSILGLVNVYPIPYLGIGFAYSLMMDHYNEDRSRFGLYLESSNQQLLYYGLSARIWRIRLGLYTGVIIDGNYTLSAQTPSGDVNIDYGIDPGKNISSGKNWLLTVEYHVLDSLTLHALFQAAGGEAELKRLSDMSGTPAAPYLFKRVTAYYAALGISYAFLL